MDFEKLKQLIEAQGTAWDEYKKTNDQRMKEIEAKGAADPLHDEKLAAIDATLKSITGDYKKLHAEHEELAKKTARPGAGGDPAAILREVKAFNLSVKAHAMRLNRPLPAAIDAEGLEAYKKSFDEALRKAAHDLSGEERKALSVGSDPSAGWLAPPEMEQSLDRIVSDAGAIGALARTVTIGSGVYKKPVNAGGAGFGGWGGETTEPSETGIPSLKMLEFPVGLSWAMPLATQEILEDATFDVAGWLMDEGSLIFTENEAQGYVDGDGVNKPRGILSYPIVANASYAWGKVGYVASGAASAFASTNPSDKLIDLQHALKRQYRGNANWVMNDATLGQIRKFKDGQGNYLWVPGLAAGMIGQLLGSPVATDDFMPDVGTDAYAIAYADFMRAYVRVVRRGLTVLVDPYTAKPYVKYWMTRRIGGGIQMFEAIKVMKIAST